MISRRQPFRRDRLAGLIFAAFGILFAALAAHYPLGTSMRMGPGYFPMLLGVVLTGIGIVIAFSGGRHDDSPTDAPYSNSPAPSQRWRPALLISASVLLFAVAIESVGLALATFGVVAVSSLANREAHWPHVLASGAVLSVISVGVFAYGLRLPFRVLPF
jgi:hypothetical protein